MENLETKGHKAFFSAAASAVLVTAKAVVKSAISEDYKSESKHMLWGENDDFPNQLQEDVEKSTVLAPGMRLKTEMQYGAGVAHGKIIPHNGKEVFQYERDADVVSFFRKNFMDRQVFTSMYDLNYFGICHPQFIFNPARDKIAGYTLRNTRAKWVRLGKRDKYGVPSKAYVNADFGSDDHKDENTITLDVAPEFETCSWIKRSIENSTNFSGFIMPLQTIDGGRQ